MTIYSFEYAVTMISNFNQSYIECNDIIKSHAAILYMDQNDQFRRQYPWLPNTAWNLEQFFQNKDRIIHYKISRLYETRHPEEEVNAKDDSAEKFFKVTKAFTRFYFYGKRKIGLGQLGFQSSKRNWPELSREQNEAPHRQNKKDQITTK